MATVALAPRLMSLEMVAPGVPDRAEMLATDPADVTQAPELVELLLVECCCERGQAHAP